MTTSVKKQTEGGFSILEIMISLMVMMMGMMGSMAIHSASLKGNQNAQRLDQARILAERLMEDLRSETVTTLETKQNDAIPDVLTPSGVTYQQQFSVAAVAGQPNLVMVTARASFGTEGDETDRHEVILEVIRTRMEQL